MTGHDACATPDGEAIMPLNEMPKCLRPETRSLIDSALEQAWQELKEDGPADVALAPRKLAGTIVALASVDETDQRNLQGSLCMPPEERVLVHWDTARSAACNNVR